MLVFICFGPLRTDCPKRLYNPENYDLKRNLRDFHGDPVVETPSFQFRGLGFSLWSGNYDVTCHVAK